MPSWRAHGSRVPQLYRNALAHSGAFAKFNYCPSTNSEVKKCLYSVTNGGTIVLGSKTTPIENAVTLQGGYGKANSEHIAKFYEATNGITLSKTPQPVPGGLAGLVNCKEISNFIERALCELTFENGVTGVNATLELAKPASEIQISEYNLLVEKGLALKLPVRVHLENPFLGSSCYVGSSSTPLTWNLTTGATSPPSPFKSIHGTTGELELKEEAEIAELLGNELVEATGPHPERPAAANHSQSSSTPSSTSTSAYPTTPAKTQPSSRTPSTSHQQQASTNTKTTNQDPRHA